jgi:hypothetical protein
LSQTKVTLIDLSMNLNLSNWFEVF